MNVLKEFLESINYKISGGSEYCWECFGPNARYLDSSDSEDVHGTHSISAIFDSVDQTVYLIEAWDYRNDREYRWINPDFKFAHDDEASGRGIDINESLDGKKFIEIEVVEDIFEKIKGIIAGVDYDTRVKVPLTLDKDQMYDLMILAHEKDVTLNQLVEEILLEEIRKRELIESLENGI